MCATKHSLTRTKASKHPSAYMFTYTRMHSLARSLAQAFRYRLYWCSHAVFVESAFLCLHIGNKSQDHDGDRHGYSTGALRDSFAVPCSKKSCKGREDPGTHTHTHPRTRLYTSPRACPHADPLAHAYTHYPKVSFMSVEVLLALKLFWAGFDFYTESAAHVTTSRIIMHYGL